MNVVALDKPTHLKRGRRHVPARRESSVVTMLRLPKELHSALVESASENERSLSSEIVFILKQHVKAQQAES